MIFRLSRKVCDKIKTGKLPALAINENPFADWSANLFVAGRTRYIIVVNTKALYSTVLYAKGISNESHFIDRALSGIREALSHAGFEAIFRKHVVPSSGTVRLAKALDRSITGSINELILHAKYLLADGEMSPFDAGIELNQNRLSALGDKPGDHGKPNEAFKALVHRFG